MPRVVWTMLAKPGLPALALAVASMPGCAPTQQAAIEVKSVVQAQTAPTLSTEDATFLNEAGRSGITEVTFGQLARAQASRAAVRDLGLRMVTERTTMNQRLTRLAAAKQIAPTTTVDVAHQATYDRIAALNGRAFDRAFLDNAVAERAATLAIFRDEAAHGTDPDVRAFAAKGVPVLQGHLDMARKLGGRAATATS